MVGNLVLWWLTSGAVKRDFQPSIQCYTSPNEHFEHGYPHSNALLQFFFLKLQLYKPYEFACHRTNLFSTVYCRIYCHTFLTLSNQMSRYKIKCIKIHFFICIFCLCLGYRTWYFKQYFSFSIIFKTASCVFFILPKRIVNFYFRFTLGINTISCVVVVPMRIQPDVTPYIMMTWSSNSNVNVNATALRTTTL